MDIHAPKCAEPITQAVYLIDDRHMNARRDVQSGWDLDDRGSSIDFHKSYNCVLATESDIPFGVSVKRDFLPVKSGKVSFVSSFRLEDGDGFYLTFFDTDGETVLNITQHGDTFCAGGKTVFADVTNRRYCLGLEFDLDNARADVAFDGVFAGTVSLSSKNLACLKIGYPPEAAGRAELFSNYLYVNYLVNDMVFPHSAGSMDYRWKTEETPEARICRKIYAEDTFAVYGAASGSSAVYPFAKTAGKLCCEIKILTEDAGDVVTFSLLSEGQTVISVTDDGERALSSDGRLLRKHSWFVWQTLRIEANLENGIASYFHNGKDCGELPLDKTCAFADGIAVTYSSAHSHELLFREIKVFPLFPEPKDYVPVPVLPKKKDYYIGMNVCSLWRNGDQWGWDLISPFDEIVTYLGCYDEGLPEVSDWEIKWLCEHGLDFEMFCWFSSQKNAPICTPLFSDALHGGFFHAKYADCMKFCLIWEAMNCAHPGREAFRKYIVPYWIDYYFTDPRYMTIENKLVVAIFGAASLINDFGGVREAKEELDYVRSVAKQLGFDGVIFLTPGQNGLDKEFEQMGVDAFYAYNLGKGGFDEAYTKELTKERVRQTNGRYIPTVSVGFNNVAWADTRSPMMTPQTMGRVLEWFKTDVLPNNPGEDWRRKLVVFSTWNEYGEGTYLCPSGLHGFGYLDEMRKAFTESTDEHADIRPDEEQFARLGYLYPKGRKPLRSPLLVKEPLRMKPVGTVRFADLLSEGLLSYTDGIRLHAENGCVYGVSEQYDPYVYWDEASLDAEKICGVRVTVKTSKCTEKEPQKLFPYNSARLFFKTEDEPWSEAKGNIHMEVSEDGQSVYFPLDDVPAWTGSIRSLRFNPSKTACRFLLDKIEYMQKTESYSMTVDSKPYKPSHGIREEDGELYFPFDPHKGFCTLARLYHEWNAEGKTLLIDCGGKCIRFTVGKDSVDADGTAVPLAKPLELFDGLPMLPLSVFCKVTGFTFTRNGYVIALYTPISFSRRKHS